jgi:LAGLIDADG DNA endonuclease family
LTLTERQRQILVGMLLGDAHLERQRGALTARLKIEHCVRQTMYVVWKYTEWRDWVRTPPRVRARRNRLGTVSTNIGFSTLSHVELEEARLRFYRGHRKVVPTDLELPPLSMAVWFMDDGSRKSSQCRGLYLNTQNFTASEVQLLQAVMLRDVGVETTVRRQRDGLQIYIPAPSASAFTAKITEDVLPSMRYKLPG